MLSGLNSSTPPRHPWLIRLVWSGSVSHNEYNNLQHPNRECSFTAHCTMASCDHGIYILCGGKGWQGFTGLTLVTCMATSLSYCRRTDA